MNFILLPPAASGLSMSLAVHLPIPRDWDLSSPRVREATINLSGRTSVSSWVKDITNSRPKYAQAMKEETYQKLDALDRHATQTSWVLVADGVSYLVEIDVTSATRITRNGLPYREVTMDVQILGTV